MSRPNLTVQAILASGTVDITKYVMLGGGGQPVTITRGRENERANSRGASCTFRLDNRDGRFTLDSIAGAYGANWVAWVPIVVTTNSSGRYYGYLSEAPTGWADGDDGARWPIVTVTCVDTVGMESEGTALASFGNIFTAGYSPVAWWRLDEPSIATAAVDVIHAQNLTMNLFGGAVAGNELAFGADCSIPALEGATQLASKPSSPTAYGYLSGTFDLWYLTGTETTLKCWLFYAAPAAGDPDRDGTVLSMNTGSCSPYIDRVGTTLTLKMGGVTSGAAITIPLGIPLMCSLSFSRTTATLQVTGVVSGVGTAFGSSTITYTDAGADAWGGLGGVVLVGAAGGFYSNLGFSKNSATGPLNQSIFLDPAYRFSYAEWANRILTWLGMPSLVELGDDGDAFALRRQTLMPKVSGESLDKVMDSLMDAVGGVQVSDRNTGRVTIVPQWYCPALVTLQLAWFAASDLTWARDPDTYFTDVTTASGGLIASTGGWPRKARTLPDIQDATLQQQTANYLISAANMLRTSRLTGFSVNLWNRTSGDETTLLALDVGSRVALSAVPANIPANPRAVVQGYTEQIGSTAWTIVYNLTPDPSFVVEDDLAGIVESSYCILPG